MTGSDAVSLYRDWSRGEHRLARNEFYAEMTRQPGVKKVKDHREQIWFEGIAWTEESRNRLGIIKIWA